MALVVFSPSRGVYLGSCMGLGFWSKLDPAGQSCAVTFDGTQDAQDFMANWDDPAPADVQLVEVQPDEGTYASVAACVRAGLPAWLDSSASTANALPL